MAPLQEFVGMTGAAFAIEWSMQGKFLVKRDELNSGNYGDASTIVKFDCDEGMVGKAFTTKKPVLLKDVSAAPDEFVRKDMAMDGGLQSIAFLPYEDSVIELGFSEQLKSMPTKIPMSQASTAPTPDESTASDSDKEVTSMIYIPSEDSPKFQTDTMPVLQGHLSKKNTGQKRWAFVNTFRKDAGYDRKYFILRDMHLLWWDTQEDAESEEYVDGVTKCKGVLNLVEAPLQLEVVANSDTEFLLIPAEGNSSRCSYQYIVRDSEHSRADWMEKLHAHLEHAARVRVERQAHGAHEGRLTASRFPTTPLAGRILLSTQLDDITLTMPPRQDAETVDERDADTPDKWVKRHKDMVRLTGRHPFNSEPPLKKLQDAGWITPPSLHVVRNHGTVPQLDWTTHKLKVLGTPAGDIEISMVDLAAGKYGPVVSFPVSFICAGNRRKEQNMTRKTIGFNWGCAAVGNSVWTGVRLCDVLAKLGVSQVSKQHRHVQFAGPLGELPKGDTGEYGTSIDMGWALDRERDVLLAFKQNGELLTPDHGAPLRTLLPGVIGGRMVKWLSTMNVSTEPSQNHYHFNDNRVLPPHVDAELATEEGWWYKPEYIINHININSAMFEPRHNSFFRTTGATAASTVKVCGYGYVGGGLKIIRAEISLDGGSSWEMADLTRPEDPIAEARATDKHWCWSWWETEVEIARLKDCSEICCRAVDSNQNMQPMFLTWNVMGMMNNCLFRVKVHQLEDGSGVWFEHPTMPGNEAGGWMTEDAGKFDASTATECAPGRTGVAPKRCAAAVWAYEQAVSVASGKAEKKQEKAALQLSDEAGKLVKSAEDWLKNGIAMEEVEKHNHAGSAWIVVKGRVYDCTPYLQNHPGGASSIMIAAGQEATEDFEAVHSQKAWAMLQDYFMGPLKDSAAVPKPIAIADTVDVNGAFLNPRKFQKMPLIEKIVVSPDTRIFRFGLPSPTMKLGLPTGMHIFLKAQWKGETVMRPYTPMTDDNTVGHVDFLVKVYFANTHPRFPDGGKMSQQLDSMQIGDTIDAKGPLGEFNYQGDGAFTWHDKPQTCTHISMIAGGTGLTPCWQVANAVLRDPADKTKVSLLYANQTPGDILAREQLDQLAKDHPDRFKLWYTVDRVPDEAMDWQYSVGFVNEQLIRDHIFEPDDGRITVMCGPPMMQEKACMPNLLKYGYKQDDIYVF